MVISFVLKAFILILFFLSSIPTEGTTPPIVACRPVPGSVIDVMGSPRPGGRAHGGVDYAGERGQTIYAIFSGWVVDIRYEPTGGGIVVEIHHPDGTFAKYMHMFDAAMAWQVPIEDLPLPVKEGDWVNRCDPIGYVGNSGFARIYHLHLSYGEIGGWNTDPEKIGWDVVPPVEIYPYWLPVAVVGFEPTQARLMKAPFCL